MSISSPGKRYLYIIAFVSGMTTLAIELSASRLLGNVFGNSNLVWANVIGLMLLYLTVGYFVGGRLADKYPRLDVLLQVIIWAAFLCALIPIIARPVVTQAAQAVFGADAALALGSFLSVLVLFSIPVTMLGTVSPFVIRLSVQRIEESGKIAGQIYAVSTLGSLLGTFFPVLWIIPELGTTRTFLLFAGILYAVALAGLFLVNRRAALAYLSMPIIIALLAQLLLQGPLRPPAAKAALRYEKESAYNYIQVQEDSAGYRYLYLNEGQGIHSQWHKTEILYGGTWDFFLVGPYFNQPPFRADQVTSLLLIGLAAGTIPRQYTAIYGDIDIDGIEIDPAIVEAGAAYFDMNAASLPNLTAYTGDGRYLLNQMDRSYSVIGIDAYRPPYIPWHLTTVEFFLEVKARLSHNGVAIINVGRTDTDRRLVDALANTMSQVFPSVHALDVPASFNSILFGTVDSSSASNLRHNLQYRIDSIDPTLYEVMELAAASLVPLGESDIVFTDDRAPVETLVDSIVLDFLLSGRSEEFRRADEP
ncbi:MAG: fused MFS/spermidine synthase [Chloroflexota bacterium]|nr:fused MFS/spermidine synthase [Chloroflexota bacterium]